MVGSHNRLAVVGGTIIDSGGGAPNENGLILIENKRIVSVGPRETAIQADIEIIDAAGKYIIPGLMDANVHLAMNIDLETLIKYEDRYDEICVEAAQTTLKAGVTTVFDTGGPREPLIKARDMIETGRMPGSRIFLAGNILGFSGPLGPDLHDSRILGFVSKAFAKRIKDRWEDGLGRELLWMPPDEVRTLVYSHARSGIDFVKYGSSGHGAWPEIATFNFIQFSPRVQNVIVQEAHEAGITVQAHTTTVESLDIAIEAGVDIITHGEISGLTTLIPEETIEKLVERRIAVSIIPVTQRHLDTELALATRDSRRVGFAWPQFERLAKVNQRRMIEAGVIILLSTDSIMSNPVLAAESEHEPVDAMVLGEGHFNALVALEEMGMRPREILKSATANIAKAYKRDADIGTLAEGKFADLVILDGNPLDDARNYRRISMVMKEGRLVDRTALPIAPIVTRTD